MSDGPTEMRQRPGSDGEGEGDGWRTRGWQGEGGGLERVMG